MYKTVIQHTLLISSLTLLLLISVPHISHSKDITAKVIKETPLDEEISLFCTMYCLGNERKGTLESITVKPSEDDKFKVQGKAALRNRQVAGSPFNRTLYDRTVIVNSVGTLNPETCKLTVDDVTVENDFQNIVTNLLKSNSDVIGKVVDVPNCKSFLK
ncbi:MAG: hypothetical protein WBB48_02655 [Thermodesulfobacteriota bacterium]